MLLLLDPTLPLHRGLEQATSSCSAHVVALMDPAKPPADDAEQALRVHDARRSLKGLRAMLRLLRPVLGDEGHRQLNSAARDLARQLAEDRDAQVMAETARALGLDRPLPEPSPWSRVRAAAVHQDAQALHAQVDALSLPAHGWACVSQGLRDTWHKGAKSMRRAEASGDAEHFHKWRRVAKARMYQESLFVAAWPEVLGPLNNQLDQLQTALGDHHDLHVLACQTGLPAQIQQQLDQRQRALETQALALGHRLYGGTARGQEGTLEAAWRSWVACSAAPVTHSGG